jgi:hypothetical protein
MEWLSNVRLLSIEMHDKHIPDVTAMITNIIGNSLSHILRVRPFPCAEYYVWYTSDAYVSEYMLEVPDFTSSFKLWKTRCILGLKENTRIFSLTAQTPQK